MYAYFNNDWEQFAPGNALTLRRMLGVEPALGDAPVPGGGRAAGAPARARARAGARRTG